MGLNNQDIFKDLNLNLDQESAKKHGSEAINSNPSMVNKQSNPTSDPTIDSKIDQIKKKDGSLFVCKIKYFVKFSFDSKIIFFKL